MKVIKRNRIKSQVYTLAEVPPKSTPAELELSSAYILL